MRKWFLILGAGLVLAGCANFRAAGTFEYAGDNMRPNCDARPVEVDK